MPSNTSPGELSREEPTLVVGDREFKINELSDGAKRLVQAIRDAEEQALQLKRQINYIEIARRALIQELISSLPSEPDRSQHG